MCTLNTVDIFVGKFLCSSALCSLTAVKDKKWTASDKNKNRAILVFYKIMLSSYYASSVFQNCNHISLFIHTENWL